MPTISPFDFGAVGDNITDDGVALQAFFTHVSVNDVGEANVAGTFRSTKALTLGAPKIGTTPAVLPKTKMFRGKFELKMSYGDNSDAFTIYGWNSGVWEYFRATGPEVSAQGYASRKWQTGLRLLGSSQNKFENVRLGSFGFAGISADDLNNNHNDFTSIQVNDCGSGHRSGNTILGLKTDWSNPVNTGSGVGQRSTINVTTLPPDYILNGKYGGLGRMQCMIRLTHADGTARPYYIEDADVTAGTIKVFPWIDFNTAGGTADYIYGGGMYLRGGDSNVIGFERMTAKRCGIGLSNGSLYPPTAHRLLTHYCGIGIAYGAYESSASFGGHLSGCYFEANTEDIVVISRPGANQYTYIDSEYALDLSKCMSISSDRLTNGVLRNGWLGFNNVRLSHKGQEHRWVQAPYADKRGEIRNIPVDRPDQTMLLVDDTAEIYPAKLDLDLHRLFGYEAARITVIGLNDEGTPTSVKFFTQYMGDWTLNGGSNTVTYSGFTKPGPAEFVIRYNATTRDMRVYPIN